MFSFTILSASAATSTESLTCSTASSTAASSIDSLSPLEMIQKRLFECPLPSSPSAESSDDAYSALLNELQAVLEASQKDYKPLCASQPASEPVRPLPSPLTLEAIQAEIEVSQRDYQSLSALQSAPVLRIDESQGSAATPELKSVKVATVAVVEASWVGCEVEVCSTDDDADEVCSLAESSASEYSDSCSEYDYELDLSPDTDTFWQAGSGPQITFDIPRPRLGERKPRLVSSAHYPAFALAASEPVPSGWARLKTTFKQAARKIKARN